MEEESSSVSKKSTVVVLHNAVIVTVDPDSRVLLNGAIAVSGDTIAAVGRSGEVLAEYSNIADEIVDLEGRFILPGQFPLSLWNLIAIWWRIWELVVILGELGFVNTHVHTSQQLARGIADDVDLMTWLHERIWPYEASMTEEDSYISTLLCGIELIRSGVSNFFFRF